MKAISYSAGRLVGVSFIVSAVLFSALYSAPSFGFKKDTRAYKELGWHDQIERFLDESIVKNPDDPQLRLDRLNLEDAKYLISKHPKFSPKPYFVVAQHYGREARTRDLAKVYVLYAANLFKNRGFVVIDLEGPQEINLVELALKSLGMDGYDKEGEHTYSRHPSIMGSSVFKMSDTQVVLFEGQKGLDLEEEEESWKVSFNQFGYAPVSIELTKEKLKRKNFSRRTLRIVPQPESTPNTLRGKVVLSDGKSPEGILVRVYDHWGVNIGFKASTKTDALGHYVIQGVPNGKVEIKYTKAGYTQTTQGVKLENNRLVCTSDNLGKYIEEGNPDCSLMSNYNVLMPTKKVSVKYSLFVNQRRVRELVRGRTSFNAVMVDDWTRGTWGAGDSNAVSVGLKAGNASTIFREDKDGTPDVVVYTSYKNGGRIEFGQPYTYSKGFMTEIKGKVQGPIDWKKLDLKAGVVPKVGSKYLLKPLTPWEYKGQKDLFYVIMEVTNIQ